MKPIIANLEHALGAVWKHRKAVGALLGGSLFTLVIPFLLPRLPAAWRVPAGIVVVVVLIIGLLWRFPKWQVASVECLEAKERFDRENEARKTLSQILGGVVLLIGFYFTWQSFQVSRQALTDNQRATQENQKATQDNLHIASEGQITDRFTKAIGQLGDNKLEIRLGGIYALERIAKDSPKDHWSIMEVLTAYVRENARIKSELSDEKIDKHREDATGVCSLETTIWYSWMTRRRLPQAKPAPDIQAILTVIGRRTLTYGEGEDQRLDLHAASLNGADLNGANLRGANFGGANLRGADLSGVNLKDANLNGANLSGVNLEDANLSGVNLGDANLSGADLENATFRIGDETENANLSGAIFKNAVLSGVDLANGVDSNGLAQSQLDSACGDPETQIPKYGKGAVVLKRPRQWGPEL